MPLRVGIGTDSHRFSRDPSRKLMLGGVEIPSTPGMVANSDGDVILHALCNALATITGFTVLGPYADRLCLEKGVTDSSLYLVEALNRLEGYLITSVSIAVECKRPKLIEFIPKIRGRIAALLGIDAERVGLTATTGEELTAFGEGRGIHATVIVAAVKEEILGS
ncbi:MAG: 2-C-methyl-D-erythritol 2,4-cyclodiphosphate synthase [Candidatus Eisenbacteria bacterium]|uniref:2-C-methyl-D-erythritol 2,4-cyclodiphosphate synthase n=1 Tax=Eiseniibacteriota bacterium TaxID=2212470 RepID=A0A948W8V9_UNCEI|nr:2-C-methyl-D-erythritol 2,4-cyclodiphosphate synthase [Candidatus Eisenbacteria bacterium]MBU1948309.1 2-C-methyl-D-erythritol 2,4-cyclodiphosphate synthase [Candidatus Eisenbacteria bacterium]MBU2693101.1 2-C-methyl-D-erythritol 2,4-cyclodiphosphate synthase [Candidatus Eisenbacteria bacterium]